jgi:hypothetical protein
MIGWGSEVVLWKETYKKKSYVGTHSVTTDISEEIKKSHNQNMGN